MLLDLIMANEINALQGLLGAIERLCLENEILRFLLQDNWSPNQRIPWQTALSREMTDPQTQAPVRALFRDVASTSLGDVPPSCLAIFESLTKAIEQTRQQTFDRVEQARRTK